MNNTANSNEYKPFFFAFPEKPVRGKIISRYQRFLADVMLADGRVITAHVANSGSMTTCWQKDAPVSLTWHGEDNARKLKYSVQAIEMPDGWVSVNTMNPNRAVAQAITAGFIPDLSCYELLQTEIKTTAGSRFDLALYSEQQSTSPNDDLTLKPGRAIRIAAQNSKKERPITLIEIKNATLRSDDGVTFPDAVTIRGQKHLKHLMVLKERGYRCIILFFAGRSHTNWVGPAKNIDPQYAALLQQAIECGVEAMAIKVEVTANGLLLCGNLPVRA